MKRDFLEVLLKDITDETKRKEAIDKIMAENGTDINTAKGDTKKLEEDLKTLKGEKKNLEGQLEAANGTIEDLKKANPDVEALQTKIKEHEATIAQKEKEYKAEVTKLAREAINTELIGKYKAKNAKAVMALIDEFEAKDDADYKTLLDSKLKALSEADDTKFMFGEAQTKQTYNPGGGGDPTKEGLGASMAAQRNTTQAPALDPWATK
ncbi:phage scaffolding protein [Cellulosilyticum lentocellum]|uniref:Minor structural GP20 protein n=1 Tax=Cellulosilyticum lentocellum (strain ATCC 49066 / DSM 5427 / NCIMB 11756 / RHM5) TaxID=642492 RepID=F2JK42_CELLD|nr:phage scaffolding protein [Cellulosilyticum lentocellum]ADZ84457.1 minor structural GP20 protein [Cellulosilyticum lentocellum DSM 5427]